MRNQPSSFLEIACNYGCGETIYVRTDDYHGLKDAFGNYPRDLVLIWLGKAVMDALMDHHGRCSEFYGPLPDSKPWLRLVPEHDMRELR